MEIQGFMPSDAVIASIKADLGQYEAQRVSAHRAVQWRVPVFLGVFLAIVVAIAFAFNKVADSNEQWVSAPHVFLYVVALIAGFAVYAWARGPATRLQNSFRDRVIPLIFGFVSDVAYKRNETPSSFGRMPQETVGTFNRQGFDDVIAGRYEDFPFELYEATLTHKAGKSSSTIFKGVIVAFETITPFPGLLVATRKTGSVVGFFRGLFGSKLQEIQSGVPELDEAYEFRTDNPDAARPLVTGRMAKALQWLREAWPEQLARLALRDNDGFLLIPLADKNFFELPDIAVTLDYTTHVEPMVRDMASLLATAALVRKIGAPDDLPGDAAAQP